MDLSTIGLIIVLAGVWFFYKKLQKGEERLSKKDAVTVQDLFRYKDISDDGLVTLEGGTYSIVLKVQPISAKLKSQSEKDGIWLNFRTFANTLPIHSTLLLQSQYLDMSDYIDDYEAGSQKINLTPQLLESAKDVANHLRKNSERKTRDFYASIILRFNPYRDGTEAGITTGNTTIDNLIKDVRGGQTRMSSDEAEELAKSMLDEVADLCYQNLDSLGCRASRLNKIGIFHFIHQTMNRDLAPYQRIHDVYEVRGFSEFKQSYTPILKEEEWGESSGMMSRP